MRPSSISAKQADLKDMGFVSLFCLSQPVFLFLLRANAAQTQTSMHVLSYVTRRRSPLLYSFVVLGDLKPLQVNFSTVWGPPYTGGPGQTAPIARPPPLPVGGTAHTVSCSCSFHAVNLRKHKIVLNHVFILGCCEPHEQWKLRWDVDSQQVAMKSQKVAILTFSLNVHHKTICVPAQHPSSSFFRN